MASQTSAENHPVEELHSAEFRDDEDLQGESQQFEAKLRDACREKYDSLVKITPTGIADVETVMSLFRSLGLSSAEEDIAQLMGDRSECDFPFVFDMVNRARASRGVTAQQLCERLEADAVKLYPFSYVKYKLGFSVDPTWEGRVIKLSFELPPRHMLFASTGIVLLLASLAILLLMALLWVNQARNRIEHDLQSLFTLISVFSESFEQQFLLHDSAAQEDVVHGLTFLTDAVSEDLKLRLRDDVNVSANLIANLAQITTATIAPALVRKMTGMIEGLISIRTLRPALTSANLATIVLDLQAEFPDWDLVAVNTGDGSALVESRNPDCSDGPCEYSTLDCVAGAVAQNGNLFTNQTSITVHHVQAIAASVLFPALNVAVCVSADESYAASIELAALSRVVQQANDITRTTYAARPEFLLVRASSNTTIDYLTPMIRVADPCYAQGTCMEMDRFVARCIQHNISNQSTVVSYSNEDFVVSVAVFADKRFAIVSDQRVSYLEHLVQNTVINSYSIMNGLFGDRTTVEIAIGKYNTTTQVVDNQINLPFRFASDCHGPCFRRPPAIYSAVLALNSHTVGSIISPDYRPEPCVTSYGYLAATNLSLSIEHDVAETRRSALTALTAIFNSNNDLFDGSLEVVLVRDERNPPMRLYDRSASCSHVESCYKVDGLVYYRSDCVHCTGRNDRGPNITATIPTVLTNLYHCADQSCITPHGLEVFGRPLVEESTEGRFLAASGYDGSQAFIVYGFLANLSTGVILTVDQTDIQGPISRMLGLTAGIAVAVVFVGLVTLIYFSRNILDKIELEWNKYKNTIDIEKENFNQMVTGILPLRVKEDVSHGKKACAVMNGLTFTFIDLCGMSERSKHWSSELVCRYLTYTLTVIESVCKFYNLHKVRTFGDCTFIVGGLGDEAHTSHCSVRSVQSASVILQLFSEKYSHFPDRIDAIRELFADFVAANGPSFPDVTRPAVDVGHVVMPQLRIGMHFGAGISTVIETGRTPTYEIYGPGVAVAFRMETTASPNHIHMSASMKDAIEKYDNSNLVDFDAPRKTVVKGQGTVTSYFVSSVNVAIPAPVLTSLGIEYSNLRFAYEDNVRPS